LTFLVRPGDEIHIAAAKRDKSIREYVWEAVEARLKHDLVDELSAAVWSR